MIVQIIGSSLNLGDDLPFLQGILETIHDDGVVVARDWISVAQNQFNKKIIPDSTKIMWDDVHKENIEAIARSDIIIIEATNYSFQEGFYTAQALKDKKPTLLLTRKDIRSLLVHGIKHKLLSAQHYSTHEDIQKIVGKFIKINKVHTKDLRFNFFIDRQIYNYLREVSYETGKNKSEIIRELLEQEIDKEG